MTRPLALVTWFHADEPDRSGRYAQVQGDASTTSHHEVYLRCVDVCAASFRRWHPEAPVLVVLNPHALASVDRARRALWERLGVTVRIRENRHRPEQDLYGLWQNQLYLFDVFGAALEEFDDETPIAVIDSDVIVRGSLQPLADEIVRSGRVSMLIPYSETEMVNGSSRRELGEYVEELTGAAPEFPPAYLGGEFVGATGAALSELAERCEAVYAWSLGRQRGGLPHPHEEAHMISMAEPTPVSRVTGNRWIERVWTKPWTVRLLPEGVAAIPMWHLPAEKTTGIRRIHRAVDDPGSWFWTVDDQAWHRSVNRLVGVPRYGASKLVHDVVALRGNAVSAVRRRLVRSNAQLRA